jgi:hypothetical protein
VAREDYDYLASLSAHPSRQGDTSYLDPVFAANMAAALREANASGMHLGFFSGYRTPGATGSSFDASGRSLHSYGQAADISGLGGPNSAAAQQWAAIAARHGLYNPYGIGDKSEFNHWQAINHELTQAEVPAYQQAFAARGVAPAGTFAGGGGSSGGGGAGGTWAAPKGTTLTSNPFIQALGNAESNWRNIPSEVDKDYPGQPGSRSQGYLQIDTPTWLQYAAKAGVTAPNAMAASKEDQIKVASLIPMSRYGGRTLGLLHKQFGDFDASKTVGELAAQFGGGTQGGTQTASAASGTPAGASAPPAATSAAPAAGGAPAGSLPGYKPGSPAETMAKDAIKSLGLDSGGGGGAGDVKPPDLPPPPALPPAQAVGGGMMMGAGGQNVAGVQAAQQMLAAQGFMTQPSFAAYGAMPVQSVVLPGMASGLPGLPGTTLNSPSALQLAFATGSLDPYDRYSAQSGYGYGS